MDTAEDLRSLVGLGCRVLGNQEQGDLVWGHVSARDRDGRGVWMKRSGLGFDEVSGDDVILVSYDGVVLEGEGRAHLEFPIHAEVCRAREDVGAVVHSHAPHAVAFASLGVPLLPISHEPTLFVPPDIARFDLTGDLILTEELGTRLAESLGDRNAVLLTNHGIVTVGPDVPTAVVTAVLLERACQTQLRARWAGEPSHWSSDSEAVAKRDHCYAPALLRSAWDYLIRRLGEDEVDRLS